MKTVLFVGLMAYSVFSTLYASEYEYCSEHEHYYDEHRSHVNYIDQQNDKLNYELERINHKESLLQRELTRLNEARLRIHR